MRLPSASAVMSTLGFLLALLWGVYILAGLGLGGYGPNARPALLVAAVVPPTVASVLLLSAGALRLRRPTEGARLGRYLLAGIELIAGVGIGALALVLYVGGR